MCAHTHTQHQAFVETQLDTVTHHNLASFPGSPAREPGNEAMKHCDTS